MKLQSETFKLRTWSFNFEGLQWQTTPCRQGRTLPWSTSRSFQRTLYIQRAHAIQSHKPYMPNLLFMSNGNSDLFLLRGLFRKLRVRSHSMLKYSSPAAAKGFFPRLHPKGFSCGVITSGIQGVFPAGSLVVGVGLGDKFYDTKEIVPTTGPFCKQLTEVFKMAPELSMFLIQKWQFWKWADNTTGVFSHGPRSCLLYLQHQGVVHEGPLPRICALSAIYMLLSLAFR